MVAVQAGGIIVWRDRIVLRRTAKGEWVFPKGWIDPGETPLQAAIREVREETGIRAELVRFVAEVPYEVDGEVRPVAYYLLRTADAPEWSEHGGLDAGCFPVAEVGRMLTFQNNRDLWARITAEAAGLAQGTQSDPTF
ncbi:MAG: NUDIX domain-containing protein [Chloroflexi bacterium]|nr:NUDIX domain-containing protein [Chloroflexota bacterium]